MSVEIGEKIMILRQSKGLSQEKLGEMLNVSRQAVSKWETGQTIPDTEKVILMSELFKVSTDYLLKDEVPENSNQSDTINQTSDYRYKSKIGLSERIHFERKSKKTFFGIPLYHINVGLGMYKAKGIFSIGIVSTGIFSIGLISLGLLSWGFLSFGLLAVGNLALGIIAIGSVTAGIAAIGGVALGVLTIGGLSIGVYSLGGCAIASQIALGGYAQGYIAIGDIVSGQHILHIEGVVTPEIKIKIYDLIIKELPNTPLFIINMFV